MIRPRHAVTRITELLGLTGSVSPMTVSKQKPKRYREARRFIGGYLTLHAAGGIHELAEELGSPHLTPVLEMLVHEALKARHPEWYTNDFKHPLQIEAEAEIAQKKVDKLAAQLEEAQAKAEAAMNARDRAA